MPSLTNIAVFSTARCSSSRNSLRGITHSPSPHFGGGATSSFDGIFELYVYSLYYKSYTHCVIHLIYIIYPLYIHCQSPQGHWSCGLWYQLFTTSGSISCHAKDKGIFQLILFISFPNCMKSPTILLWDGSGYQNRWIFGKFPNGLWAPPSFWENYS